MQLTSLFFLCSTCMKMGLSIVISNRRIFSMQLQPQMHLSKLVRKFSNLSEQKTFVPWDFKLCSISVCLCPLASSTWPPWVIIACRLLVHVFFRTVHLMLCSRLPWIIAGLSNEPQSWSLVIIRISKDNLGLFSD